MALGDDCDELADLAWTGHISLGAWRWLHLVDLSSIRLKLGDSFPSGGRAKLDSTVMRSYVSTPDGPTSPT